MLEILPVSPFPSSYEVTFGLVKQPLHWKRFWRFKKNPRFDYSFLGGRDICRFLVLGGSLLKRDPT